MTYECIMSKATAFSVNLYHSVYEMSQTDMYLKEGFEMEKYRQHHKYHSVFSANPEQACITMAETHFELYHLRQYLTALGLRTSLDDTPFNEKTLVAATMKCECTPNTPTVNGCLNVIGDAVKDWNGGQVKEMAKKEGTRMFQIIPYWKGHKIMPPDLPPNFIVKPDNTYAPPYLDCPWLEPPGMNVLDEDGKPVTDPSVPKFWGETDAFFQHHDRFMQYYTEHYTGDPALQPILEKFTKSLSEKKGTYS